MAYKWPPALKNSLTLFATESDNDMLLRSCCSVWILLTSIAGAAVFVERHDANAVLQRWRRANSGFLEELRQGDLARECLEEKCDYEEAREIFEDDDETKLFWQAYEGHDLCLVNPCHNNGTCVFSGSSGSSYQCHCAEGFGGRYCKTKVEDLLKCLYENGQCEHFCDGSGEIRQCFCADGYKLGADGRECVAEEEFPCGRVVPQDTGAGVQTRLVGGNHCPKGNCPWQVLVQLRGQSHCGGALIKPDWVVTAAHCIHGNKPGDLTVVAGEHDLDLEEGTEQRIAVSRVVANDGYAPETGDSDIALLRLNRSVTLNRFAVPVCLPTRALANQELRHVRYHTVSGWGKRTVGGNEEFGDNQFAPLSPVLRRFSVPIIQSSECSQSSRFSVTANMLCAGYLEGQDQSCHGDDGSPLVTLFGSTHFLTGVVGWGRGCPQPGYYGVYANMANFVEWAEGVMATANNALY